MVATRLIMWLCCSLFAAVPVAALAGQQPSAGSAAGAPNAPSAGAPAPAASARINVTGGRLSASFKNIALGPLADEISKKAGIAILLQDGVGSELVSASFQKLPVDQALRQILGKQEVFFFFGIDEQQPSALKAAWIYPKGKGRGLAPVPPEKWASTHELSASLSDKDPQARGRAIETLVERKGAAAKTAVLNAMHDGSAQVRATALYAALKSGVNLPQEDLAGWALHDDSPDVRFLALQALSDSPDVRSIAEDAANDPNEAVRTKAREILARLSPSTGQSEPAPSGAAQTGNQVPDQSP